MQGLFFKMMQMEVGGGGCLGGHIGQVQWAELMNTAKYHIMLRQY